MGNDSKSGGGTLIYVWVRFNLSHIIYGPHFLAKEMSIGSGSNRRSKLRDQCNQGRCVPESEDHWISENDLSE
jgi:hypothetical protein